MLPRRCDDPLRCSVSRAPRCRSRGTYRGSRLHKNLGNQNSIYSFPTIQGRSEDEKAPAEAN